MTWVSPLVALRDQVKGRARFSDRPAAPGSLAPVGSLQAGAVEVDITPPPGMPKAGYSANAHNGSGFRTRLRARIIHLRTDTASVALVQCDLLGGSAVVQHLVAAAIADDTDIPLAGVFIGATHTHAGPGQYLGTDFYNRFASNQSGFDPGYAQFLVERISGGIIEAVAARRPARLAFGTTEVWGLTRNRSLDAHVRNEAVTDTDTPAQRKFHAVNPELHLLRVDAVDEGGPGGSSPLAAMVVFSVHGTGVPMQADEYNADIWAYLVGELAHRVRDATGAAPVIGAVEGTHADVAPAIRPGAAGHLEAARVGRGVGAEAAVLYDRLGAELQSDVALAAGLREVDLTTSRTIDGITLPNRPAVGAALVAGAHENLTPVVHRIPPFAAGHPKRWGTDNPQGVKWVIGSRWLQPIVIPLKSFPRVVPVQVLRIGPRWLVGLPFELTVETGRLIAESVAAAVPADPATDPPAEPASGASQVVVSSVANEYAGYAATAREYELQCYEGAHTLYGPDTQPFLAAQAARLAGEVQAAATGADPAHPAFVQDVLAERAFDLKLVHHLPRADPAARTSSPDRRFDGEATFVDPTRATDGFWQAEWLDVPPAELHWHEPIVRVEASDDGGATWVLADREGRRLDDQGWDLQVTAVGGDGGHRYRVRWWDPVFKRGRSFRFVLVANNGRPELASAAFR